jgi:tetratricopeptide (TPR) repeat protein/DNA-binding XRE family transcriptional regulator
MRPFEHHKESTHPLRRERQRRNMTQRELAELALVSLSTIQRAERGEPIRADSRRLLCEYLGKDAQALGLVVESDRTNGYNGVLLPARSKSDEEGASSLDVSHIVGRDGVLHQQLAYLDILPGKPRVKLSFLYGITGAGKTSCLKLLRHHLATQARFEAFSYALDIQTDKTPAEHLDTFLAAIFHWLGVPQPDGPTLPPLQERISRLLTALVQQSKQAALVLDDVQVALEPNGTLAAGWQYLLQALIDADHAATLFVASREAVWQGRDRVFVAETELEPLSTEAGVQMWRNLGFVEEDTTVLQQATEKCCGNPGMMEIVAQHLRKPIASLVWSDPSLDEDAPSEGFIRFVRDPHILSRHLALDAYPLINDIVRTQLSPEACDLLHLLAIAPVPLAPALLSYLSAAPERAYTDLRRTTLLSRKQERLSLPSLVVESVRQQLTNERITLMEQWLIDAYTHWMEHGTFLTDDEQGTVVAELVVLCFKHCRFIDAAEHLIYYGWLSFNQGHGPRLARLMEQAMRHCHWQDTLPTDCASLLLQDMLLPFLGKTTDALWHDHHQRICAAFLARMIDLPVGVAYALTHTLMVNAMSRLYFEEAQAILDTYQLSLEAGSSLRLDQDPSLLGERALLLGTWCEYAEEQGEKDKAKALREQVIALYRHYHALLNNADDARSSATRGLHKRRIAYCDHYLGYELGRNGQYEEALSFIDRSIALKEQGYAYVGGLASAYSDKAQVLLELGRFQEALAFDEKALAEIQRCVATGDALSHEEVWMYQVNRGRLYVRLGRIEEAERLLQEAKPHIHERRRMYRMFAQQALDEIEQWRRQTAASNHQLDWRWIGRFRDLVAYDGHSWLAHAGPFTDEEQAQWDRLFVRGADEGAWEQLAALMVQSRERELQAAIAEQREPRLCYPAIDIEEVRGRIASLLALDAEIEQAEPNAIVRRLYHGAIEDDVTFLRLIEATYEGTIDTFWDCNLRAFIVPPAEEVEYALLPIKREIQQGRKRAETREVAHQLREWMQTHLHLSLDLPLNTEASAATHETEPLSSSPMVSTQAARKFFETALHEGGCEGWRVAIDPKALHPRVEGGLRIFFLSSGPYRLDEVRYWFVHELVGHIGRSVTGEHSPLGLLGISTKRYQLTEEGFNQYHERQIETLHGRAAQQPEIWIGTITTGLASGVITPPQSFLSLYHFLSLYASLDQLLRYPDAPVHTVRQQAQQYALQICLRTFRGVPDLERKGVCYLKDALYLHGTRMVERAVVQDSAVLDRLAVGKVSLEVLPDLQELGIVSIPQPLRQLAYDPDLDAHILSFERTEE